MKRRRGSGDSIAQEQVVPQQDKRSAAMPVNNYAHRRGRAVQFADASTDPTPTSTLTPTTRPSSPCSGAVQSQQQSRVSAGPTRSLDPGNVPSELAPAWPFNPQDTALIRTRAYQPAFKPNVISNNCGTENTPNPVKSSKEKKKMAEPRARAARHKGQMNFPSEC